MKVALVTTAPSVTSGIGDYTRHLLPYLRELVDVDVYVPQETAGEDYLGQPARSVRELAPKSADRIVFQLGNERAHAFMLPLVRRLGGVVVQHDWILFDLATAAYPELERGGVRGHVRAWREGGIADARVYRASRRERRAKVELSRSGAPGSLLGGWHGAEPTGRWTASRAGVRLPVPDCLEVVVTVSACCGRSVRVLEFGRERARLDWSDGAPAELRFRVEDAEPGTFVLAVDGIQQSAEQRERGDTRELGAFVTSIRYRAAGGEHELDLSVAAALPTVARDLSSDRFRLPLNRSAVRWGDAFIVHSEWMRQRILIERNAMTSSGIVHHGAERRWSDDDRTLVRRELEVPRPWDTGLVAVSFGAIQEHKRVDRVLRGLALARERGADARLVLAGELRTERLDVPGLVTELDLDECVRITGWLEERTGHDWLHAADVCVNLRGPSTGGSSGGIFQALGAGRTVLASDQDEQRELPDSCILKVPVGEGEIETLAAHLLSLHEDAGLRTRLEAAAREFVDEECHWSRVAARYAELLEAFPAHRTNRKSLIKTAIEGADKARAER